MRIKLLVYNIMNGFCPEQKPYTLDEKRMNLCIKLLKKENPDILVLCEGYFWPSAKHDKLDNFDKLLNDMTKVFLPAENIFRYAPAIFSKFPISFQDLSEYHKKLVRAKILVNNKILNFDVYHPSPDHLDEDERAEFLKKHITNKINNHILCGDFNAISPEDDYNEKKLTRGFSTFMGDKAGEKIKDLLKMSTIKCIFDSGLVDVFKMKNKKFSYTIPTDLRSKNKESAIRIDYIFASKDVRVLESGIIKNELVEQISDHYPVYAVLDI